MMTKAAAARISKEMKQDYSDCKGYDPMFLGFSTSLPSFHPDLIPKISTLISDPSQVELKYHHYSTFHHSERRMPIVSMVNVDGNPLERKDNSPRLDAWLRDTRIDFKVQLDDKFYSDSDYDKGHMTRREDADWGITPQEAETAAHLTCMHTNACPQVPALNRAVFGFHGLWGKLEQLVLEKGVRKETGKSGKICVYNGPIFATHDEIYRGVQVPAQFYKIIVWINEAGEPKTTAFVLSQQDLMKLSHLKILRYDQEFKEHQCSVSYLESMTLLKFDGIRGWDTFSADSPSPVLTINLRETEELIRAHA